MFAAIKEALESQLASKQDVQKIEKSFWSLNG